MIRGRLLAGRDQEERQDVPDPHARNVAHFRPEIDRRQGPPPGRGRRGLGVGMATGDLRPGAPDGATAQGGSFFLPLYWLADTPTGTREVDLA